MCLTASLHHGLIVICLIFYSLAVYGLTVARPVITVDFLADWQAPGLRRDIDQPACSLLISGSSDAQAVMASPARYRERVS